MRMLFILAAAACTPDAPWFDEEAPPDIPSPPPVTSVVLDDDPASHPRFTNVQYASTWTTADSTPGYYGTGYSYRSTDPSNHDPASFWFNLPQPMTLEVSARWTAGSNRSDQAGFYALDDQRNLLGMATVDQTQNHNDWVGLGTWDFPSGWNRVALSRMAPAGKVVIADAVGLQVPGTGPSGDLMTELDNLTTNCNQMPGTSLFRTDVNQAYTIPICELDGAIWWSADMDIDCDGGSTALCQSDPYYLPGTAAVDSNGNYLDASFLPFVVVPLPSNGFDYAAEGITMGTAVAVLYNGQMVLSVVGDLGPRGVIGEASAAMADLFGISSHPVTGGSSSTQIKYIVFPGATWDVDPIEDVNLAAQVGEAAGWDVVSRN